MRDIKFRVWWKKAKEMDYPRRASQALDYNEDNPTIPVMQFTGLQDSKGVDIYEGDIVKGIKEDGQSAVFYDHARWQPFSLLGSFNGADYIVTGTLAPVAA